MSSITKKHCFTHPGGEDIYLFNLNNTKGTKVSVTNYGLIITSFYVNEKNIVLGFEEVKDYLSADYLAGYPYFGCVVGRYANRVNQARFTLNDHDYTVSNNKGVHQLHGGQEGFGQKVWELIEMKETPYPSLLFRYTSIDGEEGYPGKLVVDYSIALTDENEVILSWTATADEDTVVNLTHHDYFRLGKEAMAAEHQVCINASNYLRQNEDFVVDGTWVPVAGTAHDFRQLRSVGEKWNKEDGFDQTYVLDREKEGLQFAAECKNEGLSLQVYTTEPVVHFYTGKWIPFLERNGQQLFGPFSGLCFETQKEPNALNIPHFSNTVLRKGETMQAQTVYKVAHQSAAK